MAADSFDFDNEEDQRELRVTGIRNRVEGLLLDEIRGHERSAQRIIGPSGLGTPCPTQLAYMLTSPDTREDPRGGWRQTIGVATHAWLEEACKKDPNLGKDIFTERRVNVGEAFIPGQGMTDIWGTCDVYVGGMILDWKVCGITALKKARKEGPATGYIYQSHLYGRGYIRAGLPVTDVAIMMMPNSGEWRDRYFWSEPYSEAKALKALERATKYGRAIEEFGLEAVLDQAPRVFSHCDRCIFALPSDQWPQCPTAEPDAAEVRAKRARSTYEGPRKPATTLGEAISRAKY
jgi:hypothetical protein